LKKGKTRGPHLAPYPVNPEELQSRSPLVYAHAYRAEPPAHRRCAELGDFLFCRSTHKAARRLSAGADPSLNVVLPASPGGIPLTLTQTGIDAMFGSGAARVYAAAVGAAGQSSGQQWGAAEGFQADAWNRGGDFWGSSYESRWTGGGNAGRYDGGGWGGSPSWSGSWSEPARRPVQAGWPMPLEDAAPEAAGPGGGGDDSEVDLEEDERRMSEALRNRKQKKDQAASDARLAKRLKKQDDDGKKSGGAAPPPDAAPVMRRPAATPIMRRPASAWTLPIKPVVEEGDGKVSRNTFTSRWYTRAETAATAAGKKQPAIDKIRKAAYQAAGVAWDRAQR
jgi:hypothetical protein